MRTNLDAPCVELHVGVVRHKGVLHQLCQHMPPCTHHATLVNALTIWRPQAIPKNDWNDQPTYGMQPRRQVSETLPAWHCTSATSVQSGDQDKTC